MHLIFILYFRIFGWFIDSSAPESGPMGATLEIQRSQQMEALEQHMMQRNQVLYPFESAVSRLSGYWADPSRPIFAPFISERGQAIALFCSSIITPQLWKI